MLLLIWKLTSRRLVCLLVLTVASFSLNVVAARSDVSVSFYLPWNRLWELSLGGAFAYWELVAPPRLNSLQSTLARRLNAWLGSTKNARGILGLGLICWSIAFLSAKIAFPGWWATAPVMGALLLISAGPGGWVNSILLSNRSLVYIGLISYPLYLWHWPLLSFSHVVSGDEVSVGLTFVLVLAALILTAVTYKYVELPIRRLPATKGMVSGLCASMLGCLIAGLLTFDNLITAHSESYNLGKFVAASTEDWLPDYHAVAGAKWVRWAHWTVAVDGLVTVGNSPRQVVFIGDSNMQHYYPRIARIVSDHPVESRSAVFAVGSGCAPAVMEMLRYTVPNPDVDLAPCRRTIQRGIDYARRPSVDAVVLSAHWYWYLVDMTDGGKLSTDGVLSDLRHLIDDFVRQGKRVYVVLNIPRGDDFDPRLMIQRSLFPPNFRVQVRTVDREKIDRLVGPPDAKVRQVAQSAGATVIDPVEFLCNARTCPALSLNGDPMYKDGGHLRPSYVRDHVTFLDRTVLDAVPENTKKGGGM